MTEEAGKKHPIRVVARYTNLNVDRIRAWEKRYKVVSPKRDASGRRLYSDQDIERLTLLKQVSEFGRRISEIVHLSTDSLKNMLREDAIKESAVKEAQTRPSTGVVMEYFDVCFDAIKSLNTSIFYANFLRANEALGPIFLTEELLSPLIMHVSEECRRGNLQNVHSQMCKEIMHACLLLLCPLGKSSDTRFSTVVCSLEQDPELISWRSAAIAGISGWNPICLGELVDVDKIRDAVEISNSLAVIIGFGTDSENFQTPNQLRWLKTLLLNNTALIVNLPQTSSYRFALKEIGALEVHNLSELRYTLNKLVAKLN